jgi:hypothetical protein
MPTGYTAEILEKEGMTFKEFALKCARAFGACITMKEDSLDKAIPDKFEPSDYYLKNHREAIKDLHSFTHKSEGELKKQYESELKEAIESSKKSRKRVLAENDKFDSMLAQVRDWEPPTEDHVELKNFMIQQIDISRTDTSYYQIVTPESYGSFEKWKERKMDRLSNGITYHKENHEAEVERCSKRTKWVNDLRESL